jgi:filamentous hemagglutinin family protein
LGNITRLKNNSCLYQGLIGFLIFGASVLMPYTATAIDDDTLPSGGVVTSGSATLNYGTENQLNIYQNTDRAIIDWDNFNIGKNGLTQFHQNNSNSIAVNRINAENADPTQILGSIKANGTVMILDSNGIFFGKDSVIDASGIIASTGNINDTDFMNGNDALMLSDINTGASITNNGVMTAAEGGLIGLVAPHVINNGLIKANLGRVSLASGSTATIDLYGDKLVEIVATDEINQTLIENNGAILAEDGQIILSVPQAKDVINHTINMDGIISASSVTQKGGKIILEGGNIKVSGNLDANGETGGGTIRIGGGYQGKGDEINSQNTIIASTSKIEANAINQGDGGEIIIWADNATGFAGTIEAKGDLIDGKGGFVEVSGKEYLDFQGNVDLSGADQGTLLLDPDAIEIVTGTANPGEFSDDLISFAENTPGTSILGADTLSSRLSANANVVLQANNTIDVNAAIISSGSGNLSLMTGAGGIINVNQPIDVNNGDLSLIGDTFTINSTLSGFGNLNFNHVTRYRSLGIGTGSTGSNILNNAELDQIQNGFNAVQFDSYDGNMDIEAYDWDYGVLFESLAGAITVDGIQNFGVNDVTFYGRDVLDFNANLTGTGNLRFLTKGGSNISIGDDATIGDFTINDSDLAHLIDGFSEIRFQTNNGDIDYDTNSAFIFNDSASFTGRGSLTLDDLTVNGSVYTNMGRGTNDNITINGDINTSGITGGDIRLDAYDKIILNGNLLSDGGDINIVNSTVGSAMSLNQNTTLDAQDGSIIIGSGGIDAGTYNLTLTSDDYQINGALTGSANLRFENAIRFSSIGIGDGTPGANNLSNVELGNITDGWDSLYFKSNDGIMSVSAQTWNDDVTFDFGSGSDIFISGTQNVGANDLTIAGRRKLNISAPLAGTGNLLFTTRGSTTESLYIGDQAIADNGTGMQIDDVALSNIVGGWNNIRFRTDGNVGSKMVFDTGSSSHTFSDQVTFEHRRNLTINDTLTANTGSNAGYLFDGVTSSLAVHTINGNIDLSNGDGTGSVNFTDINTLNLGGDITTPNSDINIGNDIVETNIINDINLNTGSGSVVISNPQLSIGTNNLSILADEIDFTGSVTGSGDLKLGTGSNTLDVEIGTTANTLALNITDADLSRINTTGKVTIGDTANTTGTILVDSVDLTSKNYDLEIIGGAITVNDGLQGGGAIFLQTKDSNDIVVNSAIEAKGSGNSLVISADGDFINNFGVVALNADMGRWIVYSQSSETINKDGLTAAELFENDIQSLAPDSVQGTIDTIIYKNSQNISAKPLKAPNSVTTVLSQTTSNSDVLNDETTVTKAKKKKKSKNSFCLASAGSVDGACIMQGSN